VSRKEQEQLMHTLTHDPLAALLRRLLIGTLVMIALVMVGIGITHAGENVPSIGITKTVAVPS
jgi:hypothetical protein